MANWGEPQIELKIPMSSVASPQVSVGRYTYGNPLCMTWSANERIEIGSFCCIADRVVIFGGGEHRTDWVSTYPFAEVFELRGREIHGHPGSKGPTVIGHDVWLGFQSSILSGVSIGSGAVIGAGSVVSKDVPPYAVVAGNPAKVIRYRFEKTVIEELLEISWWNWPINEILDNAEILSSAEIADSISKLRLVKGRIGA